MSCPSNGSYCVSQRCASNTYEVKITYWYAGATCRYEQESSCGC